MSQYRTGTATVTSGSAIVYGNGTAWTSLDLSGPARLFMLSPAGALYYIDSVVNDTELNLTAPWGGTSASEVAYVIHLDFFPNGVPQLNENDAEVVAVYNEAMRVLAGDGGTLKAGKNLSEVSIPSKAFDTIKQLATTVSTGVVELATNTEAQSQSGTTVLTASNLAALAATTTRIGLVEKATPTEAGNGTADKYPDAAALKAIFDTKASSLEKSINIGGSSNINATADQINAGFISLNGSTTDDHDVTWPNDAAGQWIVQNNDDGGFTLTVKTATGTGVDLLGGGRQYLIRSDGTDMILVAILDAAQSWKNFFGSRSAGVEYDAPADEEITVSVVVSRLNGIVDATLLVGNADLSKTTIGAAGSTITGKGTLYATIPAGGKYTVNNFGSDINEWWEKR